MAWVAVVTLLATLTGPAPVARAAPLSSLVLNPPVPGAVTRGFDPPANRWEAGHRGVDLAATPGTQVRAAADGVVSFAGSIAGRGVLSITHDPSTALRTTYEPVRPMVRQGEQVRAGQVVAVVSTTADDHDGLHWGLVQGSAYLDPLAHLGEGVAAGGPIILLPHGASPVPVSQLPTSPWPPGEPGLPVAPGRAVRPAAGPISSRFGPRFHPILHIWKLHDGTDIAAPCGAPVRVMMAGRVVAVESGPAYGNRVIVQHADGRRSAYAHLSSTAVQVGQSLTAGQLIGAVGTTGYSTGCHLHVMGWLGDQLVDPSTWW